MINWLNGHNPGFKAMVCHDGIFSTIDAFYTTEEVWFPLQYVFIPFLDHMLIRQ
jgi:hypothetical protein